MGQIYPMGLVFASLLIMTIPGLFYNNFTNSNLTEAGEPTLVCSGLPDVTCHGSVAVGCQANTPTANPCDLSAASISFLNSKSPFTQMIQGNIFALFTNLNGQSYNGPGAQTTPLGQVHGPFDVVGGGTFYEANCNWATVGTKSQTNGLPAGAHCTAAYSDNKNMSSTDAPTWTNWNTNYAAATLKIPFYAPTLGNTTFGASCAWIGQVNYTALANGPGFTYYGCDVWKPNGAEAVTLPIWSYMIALSVQTGPVTGGTHYLVYAQLENWDTELCVAASSSTVYASSQCQTFLGNFKGVNIPGTSVTFAPSVSMANLGFFAGVILSLLGLGLTVGFGGGLSAGVNRQGSKLAQVLGISLIAWSFLYSQFSTWFTSGIFPYGLDGALGIISISLTALFFGGILWAGTQD